MWVAWGEFWVACLVGGMLFFPSVVAPVVFKALPEEQAGAFLRVMFPRYYSFIIVLGVAACVSYALAESGARGSVLAPTVGISALVVASTLWVKQFLLPKINAARDAELAGDASAGASFNTMHRLSVVINMVQLLALLIIFSITANRRKFFHWKKEVF